MISANYRRALSAAFVGCMLASGCADGHPVTSPVRGKVTWNGKPVSRGTVVFYPTTGRPAIGEIDARGEYALSTFGNADGAMLGAHIVSIESAAPSLPTEGGPKSMEEELQQVLKGAGKQARPPSKAARISWLVPVEYSRRETSPLTAEVQKGSNVINFDLP